MQVRIEPTPKQELVDVWGYGIDYEPDMFAAYSLYITDGDTTHSVNRVYQYHRESPIEIMEGLVIQASLYRSTSLMDRLFGSKVYFIKLKYDEEKHIYWSKDRGQTWQSIKKMTSSVEKIHSFEYQT